MIDRSADFRAELIALMDKYDVRLDYIEDRARVNFYTDDGRSRAVVLILSGDDDTIEEVAKKIL